jgi:hypothetical protein
VIGTFSLPVIIVPTVMSCFWSSDYNCFLCFANTNGIITHMFFLLTEEVNAGVAPLGDVQGPSLGAETTCLSKSNRCLIRLLQK